MDADARGRTLYHLLGSFLEGGKGKDGRDEDFPGDNSAAK